VLPAPPDIDEPSPGLEIEGVVHASRRHVEQVFARDAGRSVYLTPLEERRRNLLAVNWVADASVSRLWPNRIHVRIRERKPVAFIQIGNDEGGQSGSAAEQDPRFPARYALIDADGVILYPETPAKFELPVVVGLSREQAQSDRRLRMRRVLRMLEEVGTLADAISEIDVGDVDNLKITQQVDNRAFVLLLGHQRYRERLSRFLTNYPEIRERLPEATVFDLRIEDRVTARPAGGSAEAGAKGGR
jgi:cell division protein FtsQ